MKSKSGIPGDTNDIKTLLFRQKNPVVDFQSKEDPTLNVDLEKD